MPYWQFNFYSLALIVSALVSGAIALYAWRHRAMTGAVPLGVLMLGAVAWSFGYAMEMGGATLETRVLWAQIQYLGICSIPLGMLVLAGQSTGLTWWLTRRNLILLSILPVFTLLLVWTNGLHGLIWAETRLVVEGGLVVLDLKHGPFFWVYLSYSYVLLVCAALLLLRTIFRAYGLQRKQAIILFVGTLFPWLGNLLYITGFTLFPSLDLTPFGYTLSGLFAAYGLFRYHLLDIVPMARDKVVQNMRDGVMVLDAQARVADLNPAAQAFIGLDRQVIGRPAAEILSPYPELATSFNASETLAPLTWKQGKTVRYYDATISPLFERRKITGWLIVLHNVTESKQAQEAAESANRAKSMFLANMSHELRTPLNAILGFTQLIARDSNLTHSQRENLGIVGRSGEHLLALINEVLELSKIESGHVTLRPVEFDLYTLVLGLGEMFRLRAESKGMRLVLERSPEVPREVRADEGKLRQVLINLLGNAVKFTERGAVTLRVQPGPDAGWIHFEVQDTGVGIPAEDLERIFDAFVQTASGSEMPQGSGLGLTISRQFVQLMGGELTATSQVGVGSTFSFDIMAAPVVRSQMAARPMQEHGQTPGMLKEPVALDGGPYRLLVVEDVDANRKLLTSVLESLGPGFAVCAAVDGAEGVQIWQTWRPHLVWMDIRMPVLDGYEATRQIRAAEAGENSRTIIVALTANVFEEDRARTLAEGCDDFVRKPFREADIRDVLSRHLGINLPASEGEPASESQIQAHLPAGMPAEWVAALRQAAIEGDLDQMAAVVEQIRSTHPALASELTELNDRFEHKKILQLVQGA
ncbi:MAG: histidine kinase N-terminal 7TM domain-containing protein [Anaerolineae bacterium]